VAPDRFRVITEDVGGGFGMKAVPYAELASGQTRGAPRPSS